jgi:hypothetical protein
MGGSKSSVFMCSQTVNAEISLIFDGKAYFYITGFQLDNAQSKKFQIEIPDGPNFVHFNSFVITGLGATLQVCEGSDRAGSVIKTPYNANRNMPDNALTDVYEGVTGGTTDGTPIKTYNIGANTGNPLVDGGGTADNQPKVILRQSTKYCLDITSQANGNNITLGLWWFEFDSRAV